MQEFDEKYFRLKAITKKILFDDINLGELRETLQELKEIFIEVSKIDRNHPNYEKDINHNTGIAVGTKWAELCVDDFIRTQKFLKGTYLAIKNKLLAKKDKPVTLLYVGTGPFATLVTPLTTFFSPEELQLILVEINPTTLGYLKNTFENLKIRNYVKEIIQEDAAKLILKKPEEIDILLTECLQNALVKEQQVAISYNILPQLNKESLLIPKEIKLNLCLINGKQHTEYMLSLENIKPNYYKILNNIFLLNKEKILENSNLDFPEIETKITENDKANYDKIVISTEICVFENEILEPNQTSLTMMYRIDEMEKIKNNNSLITKYQISKKPGFEVKWT